MDWNLTICVEGMRLGLGRGGSGCDWMSFFKVRRHAELENGHHEGVVEFH